MNSTLCASVKIDVMVPVSKDLSLLTQTLESIASARERFLLLGGDVIFYVQASHESEDLDDQLNRFVYNECVDVIRVKSMQEFYEKSQGEWIALVDVGTLWTDSILTTLAPHFSESDTMEAGIFYPREDFLKVMNAQKTLDGTSPTEITSGLRNSDWRNAPAPYLTQAKDQSAGVNHA